MAPSTPQRLMIGITLGLGPTPVVSMLVGPALTLAIRKEKSIILEMCERRFIIRYERLRSLEWVGGRVVRRGCAALGGSRSVPGERREGAQRAAVPAAVHVVESQRRGAVAWRCSARVSAAMAGGGGLEG